MISVLPNKKQIKKRRPNRARERASERGDHSGSKNPFPLFPLSLSCLFVVVSVRGSFMFLFRACATPCAVESRLSCFLRAGVPCAAFLPTLSSSSSFSSSFSFSSLDYLLSSLSPSQCTSKNNNHKPPPPQRRTLSLYPERNTFSDLTTTTTCFPLSFERRRRRRRLVTYTMSAASTSTSTVVFVLGGPGSGKGTQCKRLTEHFGFVHFSAGDLLRAFVKSGTEEGNQVAAMMQEGKIVPSEVTVNLLKKAMEESGKNKFLIDGFPRNLENRDTFLRVVSHERTKTRILSLFL